MRRGTFWLVFGLAVGCGRPALFPEGVPNGPTTPPDSSVIEISINETGPGVTGGPHADFPLLVHVSDPDLIAQSYLHFSAEESGTEPLDFEIEAFNASAGDLTAWVRIPSLTGTTTFYLRYGPQGTPTENVPGVWRANFTGVWHLSQDPSGQGDVIRDSSIEGNNGNPSGSMSANDLVPGRIVTGLDFDGDGFGGGGGGGGSDWIDLGESQSLDLTEEMTIEAWVQPDVTDDYMGIAGKQTSQGFGQGFDYNGYALAKVNDNTFRFQVSGNDTTDLVDSDDAYDDTDWHFIVGTCRNGTHYLYIDGVEQQETSQKNRDSSGDVAFIGRQYSDSNNRTWNGIIDEVRISNAGRSAGWIRTQYDNTVNPDAFLNVSK